MQESYVQWIDAVVEKEPRLTAFGLGVHDETRLSPSQYKANFDRDRAEMYGADCEEQFEQCLRFLAHVEPTTEFNRRRASYGFKHDCERWCGRYVSNGMFIAAAIHAGFKWRRVAAASPSVVLNISQRSVDQLRPKAA